MVADPPLDSLTGTCEESWTCKPHAANAFPFKAYAALELLVYQALSWTCEPHAARAFPLSLLLIPQAYAALKLLVYALSY